MPCLRGRQDGDNNRGAIDPATVTQWEECAAVGMPRAAERVPHIGGEAALVDDPGYYPGFGRRLRAAGDRVPVGPDPGRPR